ncbi:MAG: hypothetical protein V1752_05050 [Candidatus Firestonebacteria bacterium]
MAAQNKTPKKTILDILEEYNISKADLIIYASCLFVFIISVAMFVFFSLNLAKKQNDYKGFSEEYDSSQTLKTKEAQITEAYSVLDTSACELRNRFLSEKQVNDFKEVVKKLAKKYGCDKMDATERAEPVDLVKSFVIKKKDGTKDTIKVKFKRRSMEFNFQMTLGNFFGFLKSFENSNKMIEVQPFRLAQGDSKNTVKLNNFNVMVYIVPADLDKELADLIGDVKFEEYVTDVMLGEKAQVVPITEKKIMVKETVKTKDGEWDIRPIFKVIEPPKPKAPVPPAELRYFISASPVFGFTYNNEQNNPYYAKVGGILKNRSNKTIPNYDNLKLIEVTKTGFVLEMDEVTGELSKLKR